MKASLLVMVPLLSNALLGFSAAPGSTLNLVFLISTVGCFYVSITGNSYYNAWFSNYKAHWQWRQQWQKFRGNLGTNLEKRSASLLPVKCEFSG